MPADALLQSMPFCGILNIGIVSAEPEEVVLTLGYAPERCTAGGVTHGGALVSLADSAGAICAFLNLPEGAGGTTTVESSTRFIRAFTEGTVTATARPVHAGRRNVVVQTEVRNEAGKLVTLTTQTQAVL